MTQFRIDIIVDPKSAQSGGAVAQQALAGVGKAAKDAGAAARQAAIDFDGPAKKLPGFLKLGGAAQAQASKMGEAVGAAAGKFGIMGSAAGVAVGAFQSFAMGGPIGAAIFALSQLQGVIGDVVDKLGGLGESIHDSTGGLLAGAIPYDNLKATIKDMSASAAEAGKATVELAANVQASLSATDAYAKSLQGIARIFEGGNLSLGDVDGLREAGREAQKLAEKAAELSAITNAGAQGTDKQKADYAAMTEIIAKNAGMLAASNDATKAALSIVEGIETRRGDAAYKLQVAETLVLALKHDHADASREVVEAERQVESLKRAQMTGGPRIVADAKATAQAARELKEHLQAALVLAMKDGDSTVIGMVKKQIDDANKAAKAATGSGGGLSAYGQFIKDLNDPATKFLKTQDLLARAMVEGKAPADVMSDALERQTAAYWALTMAQRAQVDAAGDKKRGVTTIAGVREEGPAVAGRTFDDALGGGLSPSAVNMDPVGMSAEAQAEAAKMYAAFREQHDGFQTSLEAGFLSAAQQATDVTGAINSAFSNAFGGIEDSLVSLVTTGKANFGDLARSIMADIARILVKQAMLGALTGIGRMAGGTKGQSDGLADKLASLTGFASGGRMQMGGRGGTDSELAAFRVSPNERITIETPEQVRQSTQSPVNVGGPRIMNSIDPGMVLDVLGSGAGERMVMNVISRNAGLIKRLNR